ncbi:MAG: hypothetical protein EXQ69_04265 [Acidimicrobiia bacterium]|nr:hypothetical protein [Acidimicrobiia bacterium]
MSKRIGISEKVRLPVLSDGSALPLAEPLVDSVILPRDKDKKERLEWLVAKGAVELGGLADTRGSWMSVNRHVVLDSGIGKRSMPSAREQLDVLFSERHITIYVDRDNSDPVRIAVNPPFSSGERHEIFVAAGYKSNKPSVSTKPVIATLGLLTETSKMGCYSFNLPAGPPKLGGTCPAAGLGFMYSTVGDIVKSQNGKRDPAVEIDIERFICNGCYAIKGAYGNPSTVAAMQLRLHVVRELLGNEGKASKRSSNVHFVSADDFEFLKGYGKSKGVNKPHLVIALGAADHGAMVRPAKIGFSDVMIMAISEARSKVRERREKLRHFGYTAADYERSEEALTWLAARKTIRKLLAAIDAASSDGASVKLVNQLDAVLAESHMTIDDALSNKAKHKKVFADWQLPDPDYFRIHDAGDMYSDAYFRSWLKVCRHFSSGSNATRFWAPTRMWAFAGGLTDKSLKEIPENLAMRPSTLHFRDAAPTRDYLDSLGLPRYRSGEGGGLSAASGSAPELPSKSDYKCPAYEHWTKGGGALVLNNKTKKGVGGTCITAKGPNGENGCRACWQYNDTVVFYEEH